jgi:hypothetical protein
MNKSLVLSLFIFVRKLQVSLEFCSCVTKQVSTCTVYDMCNSGNVCLKMLFRVNISITSNQMKMAFVALCNDVGKKMSEVTVGRMYTY